MNNEEQITARIRCSKDSELLYFTYNKMQSKAILILLICIPIMYRVFEYASLPGLGDERLFFVIIFILGLFTVYFCIANILNKTRISVTKDRLEVIEGPIPWPNSIKINVSAIHGVRIKSKLYSFSFSPSNAEVFDVYSIDKRNEEHLLVSRIIDEEEAIIISFNISQFLGVEDRENGTP